MRALPMSVIIILGLGAGCGGDAGTPDGTGDTAIATDTRADGADGDDATAGDDATGGSDGADVETTGDVAAEVSDSEVASDAEATDTTVEETSANLCSQLRPYDCDYEPAATYAITTTRVDGLTYTDVLGETRSFDLVYYRPTGLQGELPVVILSHGGRQGQTNPGQSLPEWGRIFARAGYLAVAVASPRRSAEGYTALCNALQVQAGITCGIYIDWDMPHDIMRALDWLDAPPAELVGAIDRAHIAYVGHGEGAGSVLMTLGATRDYKCAQPWGQAQSCQVADLVTLRDDRITVGIALSPPGPDSQGFMRESYGAVTRPLLMATGLGDGALGELAGRLEVWPLLPPGNKYKLFLNDQGASNTFFEEDFASCDPADTPCTEMQEALVSACLAFVDTHLKSRNRAGQWLASNNAETGSGGLAVWESK